MERNDEMSDMKKIVLADASEEFRRMLAELVAEEPDLTVAGETASGEELLELISTQRPDVVVLDLLLTGMDGLEALEQIGHARFYRKSPTVAEYCEKWLLMQSVHVRQTTLTDYTSKVRRHIIKELGEMRMADVTLDDIQLALVPVSKKSASVYKAVVILYKSIFRAAKESHVIEVNPTLHLNAKGGGVPQEDR